MAKREFAVKILVGSLVALIAGHSFAADTLPSWNDTASKQAIIEFVD
jgi:Leu/Phe-tRNA-protein transferase